MSACLDCTASATVKGRCRKHYKLAWQRAHPEKRRAYYESDYQKNKARFLKHSTAWSKANPERSRRLTKNWEQAFPDRRLASRRKWEALNPEKVRAMDSNKQARRLSAEGSHTAAEVKTLFSRQRGCCAICSDELDAKYHKDHIVPLALGGTNYIQNIQLACPRCNQEKRARHPVEFMQSRGFLL